MKLISSRAVGSPARFSRIEPNCSSLDSSSPSSKGATLPSNSRARTITQATFSAEISRSGKFILLKAFRLGPVDRGGRESRPELGEDIAKHRLGQHAGVRIVARAVVTVVEVRAGRRRMHGAMREGECGP